MVGSGGLKVPNGGQCRTKKERVVGSGGLKGPNGEQCRTKRTG
jgi:hypothetical protein